MKASDIPSKFALAFGANATAGFIRPIPTTSGDPAAASLSLGFPPNTATPVGAGGTPPNIQDFNGILNQATAWDLWGSAGGPVAYDATFQAALLPTPGYPKGAIVASATTFGQYWLSTADDNVTNPDTGGAGWAGFTLPIQSAGGDINGYYNATLDYWQRGISGTISSGSSAYAADGAWLSPTGATLAWSRVAGINQTLYSLSLACATGLTDVKLSTDIESFNAAKYRNQVCLAQWKIKNNTGSSITPKGAVAHANSADNFSAVTFDLAATNLQACPDGAVTTVAIAFTMGALAGNGITALLDLGTGLNTASGSVQVAEFDLRVMPSVYPTGLVSAPPPPELRNVSDEADLVYRYLWGPTQTHGVGNVQGSASQMTGILRMPATMRATPTVTQVTSVGNWTVAYQGASTPSNGISNYISSSDSIAFNVQLPGTPFVVGDGGYISVNSGSATLPAFLASAEMRP